MILYIRNDPDEEQQCDIEFLMQVQLRNKYLIHEILVDDVISSLTVNNITYAVLHCFFSS